VKRLLGPLALDVLFIDGDHTYEGVKRDFLMYKPLVRNGGLIALHDIVPHPSHPDVKVDIFWKELKQQFPTREIVADWKQGWGGIGVVFT
jgi:predicted O-methyltransferase YrrM